MHHVVHPYIKGLYVQYKKSKFIEIMVEISLKII